MPARGPGLFGSMWEPNLPPRYLPGLLAEVISSMSRLEELEFILDCGVEAIKQFETEFKRRDLTLSTVKKLVLGPNMHFLIAMCPSLNSLETSDGYPWYPRILLEGNERHDLMNATKGAMNLEEFGMHLRWNPTDLEQVRENMPQLKTLNLLGTISRKDCHCYCCSGGLPLTRKKIRNIAPALGRFSTLTQVHLPPGFGTGLCRQDPDEPSIGPSSVLSMQMRRRTTRLAMWMIDEVSKELIAEAPRLETLVIGSLRSSFAYKDKIFWPWTGRVKEFLMLAWPRYQARQGDAYEADEKVDAPLFGKFMSEEEGIKDSWRPKLWKDYSWSAAWEFEDVSMQYEGDDPEVKLLMQDEVYFQEKPIGR